MVYELLTPEIPILHRPGCFLEGLLAISVYWLGLLYYQLLYFRNIKYVRKFVSVSLLPIYVESDRNLTALCKELTSVTLLGLACKRYDRDIILVGYKQLQSAHHCVCCPP
jgi:hypothetical protein